MIRNIREIQHAIPQYLTPIKDKPIPTYSAYKDPIPTTLSRFCMKRPALTIQQKALENKITKKALILRYQCQQNKLKTVHN